MSLYVQISDFQGQDKIAKDIFTTSDLQKYIDKYEVIYLQDLLGATLYTAFAVDFAITGTAPTAAKFVEIWNEIATDNACGIVRSEGIKAMLVLFIYFEYLRDQPVKNNIGGGQINQQVNSVQADFTQTNIYTNYNQAIDSFWAIQWTINDNVNNYDWTDFNGIFKRKTSAI